MAKPRIKLNSREFEAFLKSSQVRPLLRDVAERVAARARATAPVDTGAYRDGIVVRDDTTDRAVARVVSTDRKTPLIEARTGNLKRAFGGAS